MTRKQLRDQMIETFDLGDLRDLAYFHLHLDLDRLPGEGLDDKVFSLMRECEKQGRMAELVEACRAERPKLDWEVPEPPKRPDPPPAAEARAAPSPDPGPAALPTFNPVGSWVIQTPMGVVSEVTLHANGFCSGVTYHGFARSPYSGQWGFNPQTGIMEIRGMQNGLAPFQNLWTFQGADEVGYLLLGVNGAMYRFVRQG